MGVYTVARDDFVNARRSSVVLAVVGTFAVLVAMVFGAEMDIYPDAYRTLWDVSALIAFAFPIFVAPLTYLAIAGERESGTIKFSLGLPNTRGEYFLAKYASRVSVAVATVVVSTAVGFVVALATYENGADPVRFATFAAVSALFAAAIAGTFLALSATTASRSRAMFAVIGTYFVMLPFWFGIIPFVNLGNLLDTLSSVPGVSLSESTRDLIGTLSPVQAYFSSTEFVYRGVLDEYGVFEQIRSQPDTLAFDPWFAIAVLVGWAVVPTVLSFLWFRRSELG